MIFLARRIASSIYYSLHLPHQLPCIFPGCPLHQDQTGGSVNPVSVASLKERVGFFVEQMGPETILVLNRHRDGQVHVRGGRFAAEGASGCREDNHQHGVKSGDQILTARSD